MHRSLFFYVDIFKKLIGGSFGPYYEYHLVLILFSSSYKWIVRTRWNSSLKIIIIWIHRIQSLFKQTVKANSNKSSVTRSCQTRTSDIYHYIIISHINKNIALNILSSNETNNIKCIRQLTILLKMLKYSLINSQQCPTSLSQPIPMKKLEIVTILRNVYF